ncbi:hypothetical protein AAEU29_15895 [Pseudoalteromonas sp. SSM20]
MQEHIVFIDLEKGTPFPAINALSKCFLSLAEIKYLQVTWVYVFSIR